MSIDPSRSSIGMPDTWSLVRRTVARITAQLPTLKFRANDPDRANRVSRRLMHQWDRAGIQRLQKKHATQAVLFGWSVRPWYWADETFRRTRRVDPFNPESADAIQEQYADEIAQIIAADENLQDALTSGKGEEALQEVFAALLAKKGKGALLPIKYDYTAYAGPKADFLLNADCFPEPNFQSIQTSNWFIVERRRNREWLENLQKWAKREGHNKVVKGVNKLFADKPNGSQKIAGEPGLRSSMFAAVGKAADDFMAGDRKGEAMWLITERHVPGRKSKLAYVCEGISLGEIEYPYELDGKIPFTELVLIDSLTDGIGDSASRVIRGLQLMHDRQNMLRHDLAAGVMQPLYWTTDQDLYDNPEMLERKGGFRLVKVETPNALGSFNEGAAMSAVAVGMQDESGILRQIQMATGESNMSMQANVDPQQARTATGARIMAYNQDVLSRDLVDMFNQSSLRADADMMYLLNRSEMEDSVEFDAAPYNRDYSSEQAAPQEQVIEVSPEDFQIDGEIDVEIGSTLADDDDSKIARAQTLWSTAASMPNKFNMDAARDYVLKTLGEGARLQEWAAPPPPPEGPPPPKSNVNVSFKAEELDEEQRKMVLEQVGLKPPDPPPPPEGPGQPGMSPTSAVPDLSLDASQVPSDGAYAASRGKLPVEAQ